METDGFLIMIGQYCEIKKLSVANKTQKLKNLCCKMVLSIDQIISKIYNGNL